MIKIEITDPHKMAAHELKTFADYLIACAHNVELQPPEPAYAVPNFARSSGFINPMGDVNPPSVGSSEKFSPEVNEIADELFPDEPIVKPTNPGRVELDIHGLPWDARIHSRTRSKNNDGSWRSQRGIDPNKVATVEKELRAALAAPSVPVVPAAPVEVPAAPVVPVEVPAAPVVPAAPIGTVTVPSFAPVEITPRVEPPVVPPEPTFATLMNKITASIQNGRLKSYQLNQILESVGIPSLPVVSTRPDLIPTILTLLDAELGKHL